MKEEKKNIRRTFLALNKQKNEREREIKVNKEEEEEEFKLIQIK